MSASCLACGGVGRNYSHIQWVSGIQMYISLWERNRDAFSLELIIYGHAQLACNCEPAAQFFSLESHGDQQATIAKLIERNEWFRIVKYHGVFVRNATNDVKRICHIGAIGHAYLQGITGNYI